MLQVDNDGNRNSLKRSPSMKRFQLFLGIFQELIFVLCTYTAVPPRFRFGGEHFRVVGLLGGGAKNLIYLLCRYFMLNTHVFITELRLKLRILNIKILRNVEIMFLLSLGKC